MKKLNKELFNPSFSHIYVENKALKYTNTNKILDKFSQSKIIKINHYKDVFSRSHQNYTLQKQTPNLILAVKEDNYIYKGAQMCEDFGNRYFYYTSTIMNCIYDCEYCYLQGMYPSANVVVFVNIEDYFSRIEKLIKNHPVYLCISYDTDILAFENLIGYGKKWIEFVKRNENLKIELRTKSVNFKSIEDIEATKNIILAWTLSPNRVINNYENKTPSLEERIINIKRAMNKGWKVRLCFDPILYVKEWKEEYSKLIKTVFSELPEEKINDVSIGVFRVSKDYLKIMKKQRQNSVILNYPFETVDGVSSYPHKLSNDMVSYVHNLVKKHIDEEKIYI